MKQLKKVKPDKLQESARDVYNLYVVPSAKHAIRVDSTLVRKMEVYLTDGLDDEGFFEAQKQIYRKMEEKFYRKFVISEEYVQYICQLESALDHFRSQQGDEGEEQLLLDWSDGTENFDQQVINGVDVLVVFAQKNRIFMKNAFLFPFSFSSSLQLILLPLR